MITKYIPPARERMARLDPPTVTQADKERFLALLARLKMTKAEALRQAVLEWMERHTQTDEVFVLLEGWATLLIGGNQGKIDNIQAVGMASGKIYNVKQNTWHSALLSRDALILIVENRDTGEGNSELFQLTAEQRQVILELENYR